MKLPRLKLEIVLCAIVMACAGGGAAGTEGVVFYVSPRGDDSGPGSRERPFATLHRARDAVRAVIRAGRPAGGVRVRLTAGLHALREPLVLTPEDSGTAAAPIIYEASPGEVAVISGGRVVSGRKKAAGPLWMAQVDEATRGSGRFTQLFVGGVRQVRARHPNFDPARPRTGGFLAVRGPERWQGDFGSRVGAVHNPGDWLEYEIAIPASGEYVCWFNYSAANKVFGLSRMDGRTHLAVDNAAPVPLQNLVDTGDWSRYAWAPCARLKLEAGKHTIRWTNVEGGGLGLDAFALCDDVTWTPRGTTDIAAGPGKHLVVQQFEAFSRRHAAQMTADGFVEKTGTKFFFDKGALEAWPGSPDKEVHLFIYEGGMCSNAIVPIAGIAADQAQVTLAYAPGAHHAEPGARFFVENVRERLDAPSEWFLDRKSGALEFWPPSPDFAGTGALISVLDRLIELRGQGTAAVEHVEFVGLGFENTDFTRQRQDWYHSDDAAIWLKAARSCRITNCRFKNLGGTGIVIVGPGRENVIAGNEFADLGAGAVTINGNADNQHLGAGDPENPAERNTVAGNFIHDTGIIFKHGNPILINSARNNIIAQNTIHDHPRHGIIITAASGGNMVEYNALRRNCLETGDCGGIYAYGVDGAPTPNVIRGNLVVDTRGMATEPAGKIVTPTFSWGIYLDGNSSRFVVERNVVVGHVLGGVLINGGHDNTVDNNVFVNGQDAQLAYSDTDRRGYANKFWRNIIVWNDPRAALLRNFDWLKGDKRIDADNNVYWFGGAPVPEFAALQQAGLDMHSLVADPLFVDLANVDVRLRPGSPALRLGIQSIDLTGVGVSGYQRGLDRTAPADR